MAGGAFCGYFLLLSFPVLPNAILQYFALELWPNFWLLHFTVQHFMIP